MRRKRLEDEQRMNDLLDENRRLGELLQRAEAEIDKRKEDLQRMNDLLRENRRLGGLLQRAEAEIDKLQEKFSNCEKDALVSLWLESGLLYSVHHTVFTGVCRMFRLFVVFRTPLATTCR